MAEETKNDNFDDSLENNDDFDFLEEDEIKAEPQVSAAPPKALPSVVPVKQFIIVGCVAVAGIFAYQTIHKKNHAIDNPEDAVAAEIAKKVSQTVSIQVKPTKEETTAENGPITGKKPALTTNPALPGMNQLPSKDNSAKNIINAGPIPSAPSADASSSTAQENSTVNAKSTTDTTNNNNATNNPEQSKASATAKSDKAQKEMADLFSTTSVEQSNSLENVVAEQARESAAAAIAKSKNQNMDLYFGSNTPRNKIDNNDRQSDKDRENKEREEYKMQAQLHHTVESMTQEITENVNRIKQLEDKLGEMTKLLAKVNQNIGAIDARMLGITESVDSLTRDVSNVKKVIADEDLDLAGPANKSEPKTQLTYKPPGYSIHAIIPGRAWLKSSSGQIITVAEGDAVGDYGTVAVIDAANNVVRTSSGVSFR